MNICINKKCVVGQSLASNDLILHLDVLQLVPKLASIWPLHDFVRGGEGQFEDQVVVERLWVEDSVVGEDGVAREDIYFWVKFVKMPNQKHKLVRLYLTVLCILIKHALSTNQSARYIETLL